MTFLRVALGALIGFAACLLLMALLGQMAGVNEALLMAVIGGGVGGWLGYRSARRRVTIPVRPE